MLKIISKAAYDQYEADAATVAAIRSILPVREPDVKMTLAERVEFMLRCYDMAKETIDLQGAQLRQADERNAALTRELAPLKAAEEKRLEGLRKGNEARRAEAQQRRNLKLVAPAEAVAA